MTRVVERREWLEGEGGGLTGTPSGRGARSSLKIRAPDAASPSPKPPKPPSSRIPSASTSRRPRATGSLGVDARRGRPGFEAGCAGKIAYPTENAARAGLEMLIRDRAVRRKTGFDLYHCRYCNEWHHGHTGKAD